MARGTPEVDLIGYFEPLIQVSPHESEIISLT